MARAGRHSGRSQRRRADFAERHVPPVLWPFIIDNAERLGVAASTVALCCLVSCAAVISEEWRLQPKRLDDTWTERACLWGAVVGPPSILKTPVISVSTAPVIALEIAARKTWEAEMAEHPAVVEAWRKAGKVGPEPPEPRQGRYLVESTTIEALQEVLRDDRRAKFAAVQGKVLVKRDELSEFFASMDQYTTSGGDRSAYIRLYDGGRFTVDRISRGSFSANSWSGCILGGIQPEPIQRIATEAADDGLLQRPLYDVPDPQSGGQDRVPNRDALAAYRDLFPALAALHPERSGSPVILHSEAHAAREEINALAVAMAARPDCSRRLQSGFGKSARHVRPPVPHVPSD